MPAVPLSRYEFSFVERDDEDNTYLQVPEPLTRETFPDDMQIIVGEGDTLWSLAERAWSVIREIDPDQELRPTGFWDIIAELNNITDPREKLEPGTTLRIPDVERLFSVYRVAPAYFQRNRAT